MRRDGRRFPGLRGGGERRRQHFSKGVEQLASGQEPTGPRVQPFAVRAGERYLQAAAETENKAA